MSENSNLARAAFTYLVREHIRDKMDDPVGEYLVALMNKGVVESPVVEVVPASIPPPC